MFKVAAMDFAIPHALPFYLLLGGVCGLAAVGFSKLLYFTEDLFEKLPIDELWWPAIGALGLGIIGYFVPRVLGVGYDTISDILNANLALRLLIVVMLAKAIALVLSLGSGTSEACLHRCLCRVRPWAEHSRSVSIKYFRRRIFPRELSHWSPWERFSGQPPGRRFRLLFLPSKLHAITTQCCR